MFYEYRVVIRSTGVSLQIPQSKLVCSVEFRQELLQGTHAVRTLYATLQVG